MTTHEWMERTPDGQRYYRADRFAKRWRIITTLKHEEHWQEMNPVPMETLQELRTIVWNKYQRKRLGYTVIEEVDGMIAAAAESGFYIPPSPGKDEKLGALATNKINFFKSGSK